MATGGPPGIALKINYWYIANKGKIRYWTTVVLLAFNTILILYVLILTAITLIRLPERDKLMESTIVSQIAWDSVKESVAPQSVQIAFADAAPLQSGNVDVAAEIKNVNATWYSPTVTYHWVINGQALPSEETYLLPNQKKVVTGFNIEVSGSASDASVQIVIEDIDWKRLPFPETYELPEFDVNNIRVLSDAQIPTRLTGDITNRSLSSFADVRIVALLFQNDRLVGVNEQVINRFMSFEERSIDLRWFEQVPVASRFDIRGDVDNLDPSMIL